MDEAYEKAFGSNRRPLYQHSSAGQSTIAENEMTDLKREVPYALEERRFEPKHIHYLPLRSDVIDIIETRADETTWKLVSFGRDKSR